MTIYEVCYYNEAAPDGYQRAYFTSRRAAERHLAEVKREYRKDKKAVEDFYNGKPGISELQHAPVYPSYNPLDGSGRVTILKFSGTPRQMVLKALRDNA